MKTWVETEIVRKAVGEGGEEMGLPDLGGYETDSEIRFSMMDRGDGTCLCRVAGPPTKIKDVEQATVPNPQTDDQARAIIQEYHPDSDLENVDVPDPEVDSMLEAEGEDPTQVRSSIQTPTVGNQVLQDQEFHALEVVANHKGVDISPHEQGVKRGRKDEYENAMKKLRK